MQQPQIRRVFHFVHFAEFTKKKAEQRENVPFASSSYKMIAVKQQYLAAGQEPPNLRPRGALVDGFNFAFSLFAIILGLSLAKVLEGFARALKRRRVVHLGWLTPMLAIFVMLDLTSFWETGWSARRFVDPQYGILLIGLAICSLYYLAASIVFPSEFGDRADFDEHYIEHRWQVMGAVLICDFITIAPVFIIRAGDVPSRVWVENVVQFSAMVTCIAWRNKRANIAALAVLISIYAYSAVMSFIQPVPL